MKDKQGRSLYIVFGKRYTGLRHKVTKTISVPIEMKATLKNVRVVVLTCAYFILGLMMFNSNAFSFVPSREQKDRENVAKWRTESERGNLDAQTVFGSSYLTGYGVGKDKEPGLKFIRDAAQKGDPTAVKILTGIIGLP